MDDGAVCHSEPAQAGRNRAPSIPKVGWDAGQDGRHSEGEGSSAAFLNNTVTQTLGQCPCQGSALAVLSPGCAKAPTHPAALPWEWHKPF